MTKVPKVLKVPKDKPEYVFDGANPHRKTPIRDAENNGNEHAWARHIDPLHPPIYTEFDWTSLAHMLGEPEANADELAEAAREIEREKLVKVVTELFRYVLQEKPLRRIGRRFMALAWVVNPALFDGESAKGLASRYRLHSTRMYEETGDASRRFGIRNRPQKHAGNFAHADRRKAKAMRAKQRGERQP